MIFQTALRQHRNEQDIDRWWTDDLGDIETSPVVEIPREVGTSVANSMGEFVTWGTFDNCREHGLTVTNAHGWTFCWYQHRNSDLIHIEGCPTSDIREYGPYGGDNKWDTLAIFWPETYVDVAACLVEMLRSADSRTTRADLKAVGAHHSNYERMKAERLLGGSLR